MQSAVIYRIYSNYIIMLGTLRINLFLVTQLTFNVRIALVTRLEFLGVWHFYQTGRISSMILIFFLIAKCTLQYIFESVEFVYNIMLLLLLSSHSLSLINF